MYEVEVLKYKTLTELYVEDPTIFAGWDEYYKAIMLNRYSYKYPRSQTVLSLTSTLHTLQLVINGWVLERINNLGLDVDINTLLNEEIKNYETPDTDVSSEVHSSRSGVLHAHVDGYLKYLSQKLLLSTSELEDRFDIWTAGLWSEIGYINVGHRCPYV